MKVKFKKLMSLVLTFAMLASVVSVPAFAAESEAVQTQALYDGYVAADFSNLDYSVIDVSASRDADLIMEGNIFKSSADAYGDGVSSLRINYYTSQPNGAFPLSTPSWRNWLTENPDAVMKIRYKTDNPGDIVNIQINNGYGVSPYYYQKYTLKEGWSVLAIRLSDIAANTDTSETSELEIKFDFTGWNVGVQNWTEEKGINIDKIWFEASDVVAPEPNGADDKVKSIPVNLNKNGKWIYDNPREGGSSKVASYTAEALPTSEYSNFTYTVAEADYENYSCSDYRNINFWMYSPYPQAGGTYIAITVKKVTAIAADGTRTYANAVVLQKAVTFDWSGWKLITIPVTDSYTGTYTVVQDETGEEITCEYYIQNIKNNDAWSSKIGLVRVQTDQTPAVDLKAELGKRKGARYIEGSNRVFHQEGRFDLESIYLSKNAPSSQPAPTPVAYSAPLKGLDTDVVVSDFNTTTYESDVNDLTYDTTAPRLYAVTAKNSKLFGGGTVTKDTSSWKISKGTTVNAGRISSDTETVATITTQKHFNMWMYSPSVMYDEYGNYSDYEVVIRVEKGTGNTNARAIIPACWQGWKLISIPFNKIYSINQTGTAETPFEVRAVKITNNTWYNANQDDLTKDITHYYSDAEIADGYRYSKINDHNLFRTSNNYFYLDRIWFSNEAAVKDFGAVTPPAGAGKDADGKTTLTWTTANPIGKVGITGSEKADVVVFDGSSYTHSEADVSFSGNSVTVAADIPSGSLVKVYLPEVFDAYGNEMPEIYRSAEVSTAKFTYTVDSNGNAKITGYTESLSADELKNLVIPEKINGKYPVVEVGGFKSVTAIESLTLPSTLKALSKEAFSGCKSLVRVTMPSCETINSNAFRECSKLAYMNSDYNGEIVLPENLTYLGSNSFRINNSIKTVILPETLTNTTNSAFYRASGITNMYFPEAMAESAYNLNLFVGGFSTYKPINAIGKNTSYIKTYAASEGAVDATSGSRLFDYVEENSDILVIDPVFVDGNGSGLRGTVKDITNPTKEVGLKARLFNVGDDDISLTGIISVKNKSGELKAVDTNDFTVPGYEGVTLDETNFTLENITLEDGDKIKVMFWEDLESIKPVVTRDIEIIIDATAEEILIMTIGNSFASDSMFYLSDIAAADGVTISPYNCYYGGRTLTTHYERWFDETPDYGLREMNGTDTTAETISSKEMAGMYDWDYIMLQGTTHATNYDKGLWGTDVVDSETMWSQMAEEIAEIAPNAKRLVNATWAPHEKNSAAVNSGMFADGTPDARGAYTAAVLPRYQLGADIFSTEKREDGSGVFLPSAVAVDYLIRHYGFPEYESLEDGTISNAADTRGLYRDDTCHLTNNVGRVLVGLVWYEMITGTPATENNYTRSTLSDEDMTMIKEAAHWACENYATYNPAEIVSAS